MAFAIAKPQTTLVSLLLKV